MSRSIRGRLTNDRSLSHNCVPTTRADPDVTPVVPTTTIQAARAIDRDRSEMLHPKRLIQRGLSTLGFAILPPLDTSLTELPRLFRAPPLTRALIAAIRKISPQLTLTASDRSREFWEAEQNGACWGEYEALSPLFQSLGRPPKVLEIGPGLGRSLVFLSKKLGWEQSKIHTYEGDGHVTRYTLLGPRFEYSFCGDLDVLRDVLRHNEIFNVTIFDAAEMQLSALPGPYDLIYSFYSVGFHWSLEHFLSDILELMGDDAVTVVTVPNKFEPFAALKQLPYRIIDWKTVWPADRWLKMLVIGKSHLPNW
jgi:hypothetical protein